MAPISNSSSTDQGITDTFWKTFELPISRRGHFFQDSAFENAYEQLNNNVRQILQRWGETDFLSELSNDSKLRPSDSLDRFRQLRRHNLKEEDQAVTVASDATTHKIVMDVHDFTNGDVKVRVEGERELVVEGRTETKTGNWTASSNSFRRRFCLPVNANLAAVSAVLSDDGILTVSAPLLSSVRGQKETEVHVVQGTQAASSGDARAGSFSSLGTNSTKKSTCTCRLEQQSQSGAGRTGREHIIPIRLDDDLDETSRDSTANRGTQATRESLIREFTTQKRMESTERNKCEASRQSLCTENSLASSRASSVTSQASGEKKDQTQSPSTPLAAKTNYVSSDTSNQLPITRRGLFFDDSFFAGMRQDFESAVNDVLGRCGESDALISGRDEASRLGRYRQLREHNLDVENQAVTIISDDTSHKMVIDVHNFLGGDVRVGVEGERELVVEGRTENKTDDWAVSSNSFRRRFCLPANTNVAAVSAVLSDDGILTVTAPILTTQHQSRETRIPIRTDGLQQKREEHVTSTFSATSGSRSPSATCPAFNVARQTSTVSTQTDAQIGGLINTNIKEKKAAAREMKESSSVALEANKQQSTSALQRPVPGSVTLPITSRGSFFGDSFFKDTWKDFQEAVRDVVSKYGDSACPADDLTHYRSLREQDLRDENQALKFTDDKSSYKVIVDVQDFMKGGNVAVRSVQDRELVVEGHVELQEDGERYKKQFHRRFVLPCTISSESVSSVMSADGVLTITAPKKALALPLRETIIPVAIEEGLHRTESLSHISEESVKSRREAHSSQQQRQAATTFKTALERSSHEESETKDISFDSSQKVHFPREHLIPVVLEEQENQLESHREGSAASVEENTQITKNKKLAESSHACTANTAFTASQTNKSSEMQSCNIATTENHLQNVAESTNSEDFQAASATAPRRAEETMNPTGGLPSIKTVPISLKGDFFSDSFFEDMTKQFTTAVQGVLQHSDAASAVSDEMASYRTQLRRNPQLENQAVHVEEDTSSFKIVLDVHEFVGGELTVEVENERALIVEGQATCEEGTSSSTLTFRRIFTLPSQANVAAITSALSSDGVLTILAPKLQQDADFTSNRKIAFESHSRRGDNTLNTTASERSSHEESQTRDISFDSSKKVASSREHIIPVVLEEQNQLESRREGSVASVEDNTQITRNKKLMESSQEAARVWGEQQLKQEATRSESSFSKTYSSSSSSSSSAQQQFSSHNVF